MKTQETLRVALVALTLSLLAIASACRKENHPIAIGTYQSPSGEESITVAESTISFHIRLSTDGKSEFRNGTYEYTVRDDGQIVPIAVGSAEAVYGIGRYDWYWDGNSISQKDDTTDAPVKLFTLKR